MHLYSLRLSFVNILDVGSSALNFFFFRYNLMANRVLLLLAMASRNDPNASSKILSETAGQFVFLL